LAYAYIKVRMNLSWRASSGGDCLFRC